MNDVICSPKCVCSKELPSKKVKMNHCLQEKVQSQWKASSSAYDYANRVEKSFASVMSVMERKRSKKDSSPTNQQVYEPPTQYSYVLEQILHDSLQKSTLARFDHPFKMETMINEKLFTSNQEDATEIRRDCSKARNESKSSSNTQLKGTASIGTSKPHKSIHLKKSKSLNDGTAKVSSTKYHSSYSHTDQHSSGDRKKETSVSSRSITRPRSLERKTHARSPIISCAKNNVSIQTPRFNSSHSHKNLQKETSSTNKHVTSPKHLNCSVQEFKDNHRCTVSSSNGNRRLEATTSNHCHVSATTPSFSSNGRRRLEADSRSLNHSDVKSNTTPSSTTSRYEKHHQPASSTKESKLGAFRDIFDPRFRHQSRGLGKCFPRGTIFKVVVSGLSTFCRWQELKDHMRQAGQVHFASVNRDGTGYVEYASYEDMKYALRRLNNSRLVSFKGVTSNLRLTEEIKVRSRSGSRSRSPKYRRGHRERSPSSLSKSAKKEGYKQNSSDRPKNKST